MPGSSQTWSFPLFPTLSVLPFLIFSLCSIKMNYTSLHVNMIKSSQVSVSDIIQPIREMKGLAVFQKDHCCVRYPASAHVVPSVFINPMDMY